MNRILNLYYLLLDNINYVAILALTFLAAALVVGGIVLLVLRRNPAAERLEKLVSRKGEAASAKPKFIQNDNPGMVAKISTPLHRIIAPSEGATRKEMRLKLIQAGFRSEQAFHNFLAAKVLLGILLPGLYLIFISFYQITPLLAVSAIFLAILGFFLPNFILGLQSRARKDEMRKALPDALDLMVVCVESGLGLDMTFRRVGDEVRPISTNLSDEFYITNMEVRAGKVREDCLKDMSLRTGLAEIHNLVTILIQTNRFGTSMAKALRVHADAMRKKRRQIAEEKAAKASVKLVFPLILFIFPALLIVLAGPAAIRVFKTLFPVFSGQ